MKSHPYAIGDLVLNPRTVLVVNQNRVFCTDVFYPCRKRGWRAQRATPLTPSETIHDSVYGSRFPERRAVVQFVQIAIDPGRLAREELLDRTREFGMLEPMRGYGLHRQKAA